MKNYFALLSCWFYLSATAQLASITYTASQAQLANPERGLYKYSATSSNPYTSLDYSTLTEYKSTQGISLLYRNFQLNNFLTKNISAEYLANMNRDFETIRAAGMKAIVRFSYSESENVRQRDATKLMILRHIQQLKPILQANSDVIAVLQTGFIGTWGEWYFTSQADFGGWGFDNTALSPDQLNNRKEVVTALLDALPTNRMLQLRNIDAKQNFYTLDPLNKQTAFLGSAASRIGFHNDCFLANETDSGTFSNPAEQRDYLAQESNFVPVGGETCKLNAPRTDCSQAMQEMQQFHWSFLNLDYYPEVIKGFQKNDCLQEIEQKLGYRLVLQSALLPKNVGSTDYLSVSISLKNIGFAAPFNPRKVYVVMRNTATGIDTKLPLTTNLRTWFGSTEFTLNENIKLPDNMPEGKYSLHLFMPDEAEKLAANPSYAIQLANKNTWDAQTGYNSLNHIVHVQKGTVALVQAKPYGITLYPVPVDHELTVLLPDCTTYQVKIMTAQGNLVNVQRLVDKNQLKINTEELPKGLYFIEFSKNGISDTRKFIVKH